MTDSTYRAWWLCLIAGLARHTPCSLLLRRTNSSDVDGAGDCGGLLLRSCPRSAAGGLLEAPCPDVRVPERDSRSCLVAVSATRGRGGRPYDRRAARSTRQRNLRLRSAGTREGAIRARVRAGQHVAVPRTARVAPFWSRFPGDRRFDTDGSMPGGRTKNALSNRRCVQCPRPQ